MNIDDRLVKVDEQFPVPRERIRQFEAKALRKPKNPVAEPEAEELLGQLVVCEPSAVG